MNTKQTEALKMALCALEVATTPFQKDRQKVLRARAAIREALTERPAQQQEPVAWMEDCADFWEHYTYISEASQENYKAEAQMWVEKLRTSPQPSKPCVAGKTWVGLTDEQIMDAAIDTNVDGSDAVVLAFARAIESKLREKNAQPSKPWVGLTQDALDKADAFLREKNA